MIKVFKGVEAKYQKIERLTLAVVITARKIIPYFQGHQVMVKTNYPIHQALKKLDLAERMMYWSVESDEYDIEYLPRGNIKLQNLIDFLAEFISLAGAKVPHI